MASITLPQTPGVLGSPNPVTVPFDPNSYLPVYMPEQSIFITAAGGIQDWVASVPQCLAFENVNDLVSAIQALGYDFTGAFPNWPFKTNGTFGGGPTTVGLVPWLGISPVPPTNSGPPDFRPIWSAADGAFVVNAGKYGAFWSHGVTPFIGSSYHTALIQDIQMRMDAARGGNPDLG